MIETENLWQVSLNMTHRMKKIWVVGTEGIPARYGGFETLAENLVIHADDDVRYTVLCSSRKRLERPRYYYTAALRYLPFAANGLASLLYDGVGMLLSLSSDCILLLGTSGAWFLPILKLLFRGKIIVNIDGIEWRRAKWSWLVRRYLRLSEMISVLFSDIVVADNAAIKRYVAQRYRRRAVLIEYGGDSFQPSAGQGTSTNSSSIGGPYAMTVCRVEPENNIHLILEAFSGEVPLRLIIVGNWNDSAYGLSLRRKYSRHPNITMLEPIYDRRRLDDIRSGAAVYVHGHSAGGTNPSLVEAMSLGLPVIAYDVEYNRETTEDRSEYFLTSDDLARKVRKLDGENASAIGRRMKSIAQRRYVWSTIARKYERLYGIL